MKYLRWTLCFPVVFFFIGLPARATVLLDDTWADGIRTNQNLPTESAWFSSTQGALAATTGAMTLTQGTTAILNVSYFTPNSSSAPIQLGVGDTLTATFKLTLDGIAPQNTSQGFKLALCDFAESTLSPIRVPADKFSNGSQGNGVQGYAMFLNMGVTFNNSSPIALEKRTNTADASLLGSSGDWMSLGSGPGNTNLFQGFATNTPYVLQFTLQRTDVSSLLVGVSWLNTVSGATLTTSFTDPAAANFNFDGIGIRPATAATSATTFVFNEVKVEVVSASTPPTINTSPVGESILVGQNAVFTVDASGSSLNYQWYYNTNSAITDATNATLTVTNVQLTDAGNYSVIVSNSAGTAVSDQAALTVSEPVGPSIFAQPLGQTALPGDSYTFSVSADGSQPLTYQWYYNTNTLLAGATSAALTLTNIQPANAGTYSVVVSNFVNAVTSSYAVLTVNTNPVAPFITADPISIVAIIGSNPSFSATAKGTDPLSYQWQKGGVAIPGATSPSLTLTNVQLTDAGSYTLLVSNSVSSATSAAAVLSVTPPVSQPNSAFNLMGFGQNTTGGSVLADTDPNYAKVFTATDLANAINSKTVKVIEIMNDLNLGYNEIEAGAKAGSEPFRADSTPLLHPVLLITGVSLIDVQKKNGLTIFSANGVTLRHGHFNVKSSANIIIRNLRFDELWEWDESSKGNYDKNNWDFITVGDAGAVTNMWIDHCTFTKAYDGIVDIKNGSAGLTISWCKYTGDDGATNTNSWVRQQINALEVNKASYAFYGFLRNNGFSVDDIVAIAQGHDKTHLIGANDLDPNNALHTVTLHHEWFINPWDRLPRLRAGNVHDFNIFVDDTAGLAARNLRNLRAAAMSTANQNLLNNTYSFNPFLNGSISTENGAMLVEKSVYIDCITPLRNNQTDPSDPIYTGKIKALDTIYQMNATVIRGNSTDPGNPLGPLQAPIIPFSWNLPNNQLPYSYTMDDPSQLQAIVTDPHYGAGAGVLTWAKTNWLLTSYAPTAPVISAQPLNQNDAVGQTATFSIVAGGSAPLTYQWYYNTNTPVLNATNATLILTNVSVTNAGGYSVIVSNSAGSAPSTTATLTVGASTGFSSWQSGEFTPQQLTNSAVSGPGATPAGDGVPNLVKYALGLHPFVVAPQPLTTGIILNGDIVLTYHRPAGITDVTYHVQVSTDLANWSETGVTQQTSGTDANGLQIWTAHFTGSASSTRYLRLLIEP